MERRIRRHSSVTTDNIVQDKEQEPVRIHYDTEKQYTSKLLRRYGRKPCTPVSMYILERYVRRELKYDHSDREIIESLQNIIVYIKLGLIKADDIVFEGI